MNNVKKVLLTIALAMLVTLLSLPGIATRALAKQGANPNQLFRITSIDVGKGDCTLCEAGPHTVLIDAGYDYTANDVLGYLKNHGVESLDALIISHYDKDHVGGAADVLLNIPVKQVYLPEYTGTSKHYKRMTEALEQTKVPFERVTKETKFNLQGARFELLPSDIAFDGDNDNDCSLCTTLRFHQYSALFAGDLEEAGIASFMKNYGTLKSCDILKMPHHGKDFDNLNEIVDLADPSIALITDGHSRRAQPAVLDNLAARNIDTHNSTDFGTTVICGLKGGGYSVDHERNGKPGIQDQSGQWRYDLQKDGTAIVAGYDGTATELVIPEAIDGHTITGIGPSAFYNNKTLKSVTIPAGVTTIDQSAFSWCTSLAHVDMPASMQSIAGFSFSYCFDLNEVSFDGTAAQWDAIEKDEDWNKKSPEDMAVNVLELAA